MHRVNLIRFHILRNKLCYILPLYVLDKKKKKCFNIVFAHGRPFEERKVSATRFRCPGFSYIAVDILKPGSVEKERSFSNIGTRNGKEFLYMRNVIANFHSSYYEKKKKINK